MTSRPIIFVVLVVVLTAIIGGAVVTSGNGDAPAGDTTDADENETEHTTTEREYSTTGECQNVTRETGETVTECP